VELFEGRVSLLDCVTTSGVCVIQPGCRLRRLLDRVGAQLVETLNGVTLADLVESPEPSLVQLSSRVPAP
jgi:DNA-binding IscR family transcriptional regulator